MGNTEKTRRLVGLSIFSALVVVLQLVAGMIRFGPFSITLTLLPIVVGAAVYGPAAGAVLGAVFGAVVAGATISGTDMGAAFLLSLKPFWTIFIIMLKGTASGWLAGLAYRFIDSEKYLGFDYGEIKPEALSAKLKRRRSVFGTAVAGIVCPVVNTGIFCVAMATIFREALLIWADGADAVYYIFTGLIGINFLIELGINAVLSPVIVRLIRAGRRGKQG